MKINVRKLKKRVKKMFAYKSVMKTLNLALICVITACLVSAMICVSAAPKTKIRVNNGATKHYEEVSVDTDGIVVAIPDESDEKEESIVKKENFSTESIVKKENFSTVSCETSDKEVATGLIRKYFDCPLTTEQQDFIFRKCADTRFNPELIVALIEHESGFRNVRSQHSWDEYADCGYCQINSKYLWSYTENTGATDLMDFYDNVTVALYILEQATDYTQDLNGILMCYNAGCGGACSMWDNGTYSTPYSRSIIERSKEFKLQIM